MTSQLFPGHECDELRHLLSTASAALATDQATARACIVRARALLPMPKTETRGGLAPWQVRRLGVHIQANLGGRLSLAELADVAGLSASHFSRAFRQTFGQAPMRYVSGQRVQRAKELILDSQTNLADVALACGLCDQAHLSRLFRRVVGASPSFWRRQFRAEPAGRSSAIAA